MPRRSYEQYRLGKLAQRQRAGSLIESETDLDSLASFSTYQSSSSHYSNLSPLVHPTPHRAASGQTSSLRPRALSSNTQRSFSPGPAGSNGAGPSYLGSALYDAGQAAREKERAERHARREQRRAARAARSTLLADKYDSPLRRWIRWCARAGLGHWMLPLGLAGVALLQVVLRLEASGSSRRPLVQHLDGDTLPPLVRQLARILATLPGGDGLVYFLQTSYALPVLVTLMWWAIIGGYLVREGEKSNRSWRTQVTGILTVLLQPSFILPCIASIPDRLSLIAGTFALYSLGAGRDVLATLAISFSLSAALSNGSAVAFTAYLFGKCIWLGGLPGLRLFLLLLANAAAPTGLSLLLAKSSSSNGAPFGFQPLLGTLQALTDNLGNWSFDDLLETAIRWTRWSSKMSVPDFSTVAISAALSPTVVVMLYSSWSTRLFTGSRAKPPASPPPTIRLLPLALFTASIPFFLFSTNGLARSAVSSLLPLTLMMALRGGRNSTGTEEETWQMGVLASHAAIFAMWPQLQQAGKCIPAIAVQIMWTGLIGYSPFAIESVIGRAFTMTSIGLMLLWHTLDVASSSWTTLRSVLPTANILLSRGILGLVWLWGLRKLVETAWAIGGLGGPSKRPHKTA